MTVVVTGKLNKAAKQHMLASGDSLFIVNIGKKERNRQENSDVWVNYSGAVFAKQGRQTDFYLNSLQAGAVVTLTGTGVLPRIWGDANDKVSLDIQDAKLGYLFTPQGGQAPQAPQQNYQQAPQSPAYDEFDDVPF